MVPSKYEHPKYKVGSTVTMKYHSEHETYKRIEGKACEVKRIYQSEANGGYYTAVKILETGYTLEAYSFRFIPSNILNL